MSLEHSHEAANHKTRRPRINLEESQETLDSASPENVISGLTLAQNRMVGLQQTVGNRAVMRSVVQRQGEHQPPAHNQPAPSTQAAPPVPASPAAPATATATPAAPGPAENQMAYTISLRLPGGAQMHFENLPRDQALRRTRLRCRIDWGPN